MASQPPASRRHKRRQRQPTYQPMPVEQVRWSDDYDEDDEDAMLDDAFYPPRGDFLRALAASERRTMQQITKMERGLHTALRQTIERFEQTYIAGATVRERWQADTANMERLGDQLGQLQEDYTNIATALPKLATTETVERAVREAFDTYGKTHPSLAHVNELIEAQIREVRKGLLTEEKAKEIIRAAFKERWDGVMRIITWIIGILAFLTVTGIIHPLALFAGH